MDTGSCGTANITPDGRSYKFIDAYNYYVSKR